MKFSFLFNDKEKIFFRLFIQIDQTSSCNFFPNIPVFGYIKMKWIEGALSQELPNFSLGFSSRNRYR